MRRGLDEHAGIVHVNLVADLIRDFGPEKGLRWLREVDEVKHLGVVGIGIGGSEQAFPPEPYEAVYEEARQRGFRTSAHAGEAAGPESVWGAATVLKVDRIGHGTRAAEDPALVAFLAERQLPLEMCPISNLRTGVVRAIASHPIRAMFDAGVRVTVNTDDPKMFNTSLEDEYQALADELEFSWPELQRLNENALCLGVVQRGRDAPPDGAHSREHLTTPLGPTTGLTCLQLTRPCLSDGAIGRTDCRAARLWRKRDGFSALRGEARDADARPALHGTSGRLSFLCTGRSTNGRGPSDGISRCCIPPAGPRLWARSS